jgi:hypothetical protein
VLVLETVTHDFWADLFAQVGEAEHELTRRLVGHTGGV